MFPYMFLRKALKIKPRRKSANDSQFHLCDSLELPTHQRLVPLAMMAIALLTMVCRRRKSTETEIKKISPKSTN